MSQSGCKRCSKCHAEKPPEDFSPHRQARDGLQSWCKRCRADDQLARVARDPEAHRARARTYERKPKRKPCAWCRGPKPAGRGSCYCSDACREAGKRARRQEHYQRNRDYYAAKNARFVQENQEANRARRRRQREIKRRAQGSHALAEWLLIRWLYGDRCLACGSRERIEPDHVIPLARGGTDDIGNIQPLCRSCNASKKVRVIDYRPALA